MRGLRRQVDKARNAGVVVTPIAADTGPGDPVWREIEALDARWLASRACPFPIRRLTRRYARRVEPHTSRLCARRASDGRLVGWCCLDLTLTLALTLTLTLTLTLSLTLTRPRRVATPRNRASRTRGLCCGGPA